MAEPPEVEGRIFISYRREDSAYPAGWLFDRLAERFGAERIFKDVDSIELGDDFVEEIEEAVGQTDVLLALIGGKWLTVADEQGSRRLDDPEDFVRLEIEAALRRSVRVIPILVEGASMPSEEQLPPSLTPLARRQALELSPARFSSDTSRLLAVLERALADARAAEEPPRIEEAPPAPGWRRRLPAKGRLLIGAAAAAVLLAGVLGGVLLIGGGGDTSPTPTREGSLSPPDNGLIAYVSDAGESGKELWEARSDGSPIRQLTTDFAEVRNPDWSPDGTKIAFASNRDNEGNDFDLWVVNAEGLEGRRVTDGPARDGAPSWSPDGCWIAFGREEVDGNTDIWIVDAKGRTEPQPVTDDSANDVTPDWSATDLIAFGSERDGHDYDIYTVDPLEPDTVTPVTENDWNDWFPDWSPTGVSIAYHSTPRGDGSDPEIFMIDVPDGLEQRLTINETDDLHPDWSPDGQLIAFDAQSDDGTIDIHAVQVATGAEEPLIPGDPNDEFAAWGIGALEAEQSDAGGDEDCAA
ncbi:MAG TPA: TIR domain-containing protein [Gaiellaceae bacterium]|nr:TIR domain-containing protein [Gaiellaceae bacterium]